MNQPSSSDQGYDPVDRYSLPTDLRMHGQSGERVRTAMGSFGNGSQLAYGYDYGAYQYSYKAQQPNSESAPLPSFSSLLRHPPQNDGRAVHYGHHQVPYPSSSAHNMPLPLPNHDPYQSYPQAHAQHHIFQMPEQPLFLATQHQTHRAPHYYNHHAESSQLPHYSSQPALSAGNRISPSVPANHTFNWGEGQSSFVPKHSGNDDTMPKPHVSFARMRMRCTKASESGEYSMKHPSAALPEPKPSILGSSILQSAVAHTHNHPSFSGYPYQSEPKSQMAASMPLEPDYSVPKFNPGGLSQPLPSLKDEDNAKEPPEASPIGNKSPCIPKQSQEVEHAYMMSPLFPGDPKEIKASPLPVLPKENIDDVPLGALAPRQKEDISIRRKSAPLHTGDILSTIPLKKSKYATPPVDQKREVKARSRACKNDDKASKRMPHKIPLDGAKLPPAKRISRGAKEHRPPVKLSRAKRRKASVSLLEHSGDEEGSESSEEEQKYQKNSTKKKIHESRGSGTANDEKRRKGTSNKNEHDSDDDDFETDQKLLSSRRKSDSEKKRTKKDKVKQHRPGSRKSPRLSKRIHQASQEAPPLRSSLGIREVRKHTRSSKMTKSLDEQADNEVALAKGNETDSSGDFEITSDRKKEFDVQQKKWRKAQESKKDPINSRGKRTKSKRTNRSMKRRRVSEKSNSDVESTDSRVDEHTSASDSPNASQRGSQPMEINFTSLSTTRRKRKTDYSDERKQLTQDELSTLRLAFVKHYPPPPSNAQAQGRFEMRYGREMSQAMIQGLWENELKHWSDRWWDFYQLFNKIARGKKLQKPVDRKPTITIKEAEAWAQTFYEDHGDARLPLPPAAELEKTDAALKKADGDDSVVDQHNTLSTANNAQASVDHSAERTATLEEFRDAEAVVVGTVSQSENIRAGSSTNISFVPAKGTDSCEDYIHSHAGAPTQSSSQAAQESGSVCPPEENAIQFCNDKIGYQGTS